MKQRKLVIGLLVILAVAVSGFTFAFWSNISTSSEVASNTVTIGEGRQASVTASLNAAGTGTLVPSGEAGNSVSSNPVESITYTFNVDWSDNAFAGGTADLAVVVDNVSNATADGLLNFTVTGAPLTITEGTQLVVSIVVTLDAPANQTDYNNIINNAVTFDVTFTISNLTA